MEFDEFQALKLQWAREEAKYCNTHFEMNGFPWIAEDFMGRSTREQRKHRAVRDEAAVLKENQRLNRLRKGEWDESIPEWAFGKKGRPNGERCNRRSPRNNQR